MKSFCLLITFLTISEIYCEDGSIVFPCRTIHNKPGLCVCFNLCPALLNASDISKYICGEQCTDMTSKVCCELVSNKNVTVQRIGEVELRRNFVINNLLPGDKFCGFQQTDDRLYSENETALDEFPWMVRVLLGDENNKPEHGCNAVILNKRYVLTSSSCAQNATTIRLGLYSLDKSVTCIEDRNFPECNDPPQVVRIEEMVLGVDKHFNLGLIRTEQAILFTDYVRPICLPLSQNGTERDRETISFIISGWGAELGFAKIRLSYNTINEQDCYNLSRQRGRNQDGNTANYICLDVPKNSSRFVCSSEIGGPIMYKDKNQWFVDSVIVDVFSNTACSYKGLVTALKLTRDAVEWILDNIKN